VNGKPCCTPGRKAAGADEGRSGFLQAPAQHGAQAGHDFIALPGGAFLMGTDAPDGFPADGEGPAREVRVNPFRMAATTVTNAQFSAFVRATGYITQAEEMGSSFVFYLQLPHEQRASARQHPHGLPWWLDVRDASWQRPEGPGSHVRDRMDHPVVHVSWDDAQAYCTWAGVELPTEAEWEYAARGGLHDKRFPWGDLMPPEPPCNIWRGGFPNQPAAPWSPGTVPARSFAANGFGLYNMAGNVWEWCADWFGPDYHRVTGQINPRYSEQTGRRSTRGGSFLCHDSYCNRYRVAARGSNTPQSSASNQGFRVAAQAQHHPL
jgi:sulfatase modifying factor 1